MGSHIENPRDGGGDFDDMLRGNALANFVSRRRRRRPGTRALMATTRSWAGAGGQRQAVRRNDHNDVLLGVPRADSAGRRRRGRADRRMSLRPG